MLKSEIVKRLSLRLLGNNTKESLGLCKLVRAAESLAESDACDNLSSLVVQTTG